MFLHLKILYIKWFEVVDCGKNVSITNHGKDKEYDITLGDYSHGERLFKWSKISFKKDQKHELIVTDWNKIRSTRIELKVTNNDGTDTTIVLQELNSVDENLNSIEQINVYPNPSSGEYLAEINQINSDNVKTYLTDLLGQTVKEISDKSLNSGKNKISFDCSNFSDGMYYLIVKTSGSYYSEKLMLIK